MNWYLVSVGDVITSLKYGTSQKCSYDSNGVPVLRIPNVSKGAIDQSDLKYAELSEKEYEELKLFPGDILLIRSNGSVSLVGKSALIGKADKDFAYAGYLIRLRPNPQLIDPTYLNMVLSSYDVRLQIEIPARSTSGVNNINSQEVKQLKIPVSPLSEQQEIVRRVQTLFKTADQIEQRYQKARGYVDQLTQSILAKAFRGELVPQDPNDEPASVLLEQIRAEQAKREAEAKAAKKSTGKKGGRRGRKPKPQGSEPIQLELPGLE
nr:restriction endonuclease subunit S [Trichocoleus sp. FACHB-40]